MRSTLTTTLALLATLGLGGAALAQSSTGAPAGRDPATAPGGTKGIAGPGNVDEAVRSGDAAPASPAPGVTEMAPPPAPPVEPAAPPVVVRP